MRPSTSSAGNGDHDNDCGDGDHDCGDDHDGGGDGIGDIRCYCEVGGKIIVIVTGTEEERFQISYK